jgi:hypothetical protein
MNPEILKAWVKKQKSVGFAQNGLLGLLAVLAGLFILFLTFWLAYGMICLVLFSLGQMLIGLIGMSKLHWIPVALVEHRMRLVYSGLFVILLIYHHFRTSPEYWSQYDKNDYSRSASAATVRSAALGTGMLLSNPGDSAKMIVDILLVGPRLVTGGIKMIAQGFRMKRIDENGCGELLAFLYSRPDGALYEELKPAGWSEWFPQLRCIEGVEFLQKHLTLSEELRGELNNLSDPQRRAIGR